MIAQTLEINWHDTKAVYSTDFSSDGLRFATGGADTSVRIWNIQRRPGTNQVNEHKKSHRSGNALPVVIDFLCELKRHSAPVNVVRFSPTGEYLASAGDDTCIILWRLATNKDSAFGSVHSEYEKETWTVVQMFYGHTKEIYDLAWSPCGQYFMTASIDNTARVWSIAEKTMIHVFSDHTHYVQGVTWDPLGEYVATQSSDRSVAIYKYRKGPLDKPIFGPCFRKHYRQDRAKAQKTEGAEESSSSRLYHDENLVSFFRRLWFSPDGALLLTPSGLFKSPTEGTGEDNGEGVSDEVRNCAYIYGRNLLQRGPVAYNGNHPKPSTVVRWCSKPYERRSKHYRTTFGLEYRMLYAVATQDTIYIHDTQQTRPICVLSGMHYAPIMDLAWSPDGTILMFASSDGYLSAVVFADGELGTLYTAPALPHTPLETVKEIEMTETIQTNNSVQTTIGDLLGITARTETGERKRTSEVQSTGPKKRRIAPTLISAPRKL
ncbi:WD40-repeat-containing domain protein [Phycomyces nitens]|nr:WD40-repeat-containing domain protein [Phycomyces nitens]